jgi:hypothetical protein
MHRDNFFPRSQTRFGNALAEALPLPILGCKDKCAKWNFRGKQGAFPSGTWERGGAGFSLRAAAVYDRRRERVRERIEVGQAGG